MKTFLQATWDWIVWRNVNGIEHPSGDSYIKRRPFYWFTPNNRYRYGTPDFG